ncbi:hypothetical protein HK105_208979 [Polyrhizophydium stewartii]|uniref:Ankyrin repeat protein n=1 Tax=Polyrhizophydium stewartii TaxID=2732419 RepID=A0ABR4MW85_9FUNG
MADIRTNDAPAAALAAPPPPAHPAAAHADPAAATAQHDRLAERLDGQPAPPPAVSPPLAAAPASTTSQPPPSTTSDAPRAVRFRPSATNEWDRMPAEIQNMILKHAGVLTLWVNGRIRSPKRISMEEFASLLCDVFETDWQGDLTKLPFRVCPYGPLNYSFWHMHTRSMHARIKALGHFWLGDGLDQAAILNGWTDLLDFDRPKELSMNAAECGSISMLEQLVDERKVVTLESGHAEKAAYSGHLEVLKWLHERMPNGSWTTQVMASAALRGKLDCLKWLHANRTEGCTTKAMNNAAADGHLSVVKWLHANRTEGCTTWAMDDAADNGHLAVVKWLHENRTEGCTEEAMSYATQAGHADIVEWLHKNCTEGNIADAAVTAAKFGEVAVIQRIHAMAPDVITQNVADEAASFGRVALLDWIIDNTSVRPAAREIARALEGKRLRTVVWFRKRMPEMFNEHPMSKIDGQSADAVIDWFEQNGLRKDFDQVIQLAINERQIVVLKWLQQHVGDDEWDRTDRERARELVAAA